MSDSPPSLSMDSWESETLHKDWAQSFVVSEVLWEGQTPFQHLKIFENPFFGRVMVLDGAIQTTQKDEFVYHEMITHVPLLAHSNPQKVLVIGAGDGGVIREVSRHPSVKEMVMVEIDGTVIEKSQAFLPGHSAGAFEDPRLTLIVDDASKFVKEATQKFDVIITDSTDPMGPGEHLFTQEFYGACKNILNPGGIMVTQSGVPFMQPKGLKNMSAMLGNFFKHHSFYLAPVPTYVGGFMAFGFGSDDGCVFDVNVETLQSRASSLSLRAQYYSPQIHKAAFVLPPFIENIIRG